MQQLEQEAAELTEILTLVHNATLHAEVLKQSKNVGGRTKHWINTSILNRLNAIKNDLFTLIPPSDVAILKRDTMNDDAALQFRDMKLRIMKLNNQQRDKLENYLTEIEHE